MENVLPFLPRDRSRQVNPLEQIETMFDDYVSSARFTGIGDIQRIMPHAVGVYEFKPVDLRVFGWFWRPGQFVAHRAGMKKDLKGTNQVDQLRKDVVEFREGLHLDPPPFTARDSIRALI